MLINLIHGSRKFSIEVADDCLSKWTTSTLKEEIANTINIPVEGQRLIFKGRTMFDTATLESLSLKPNDKIMVLSGAKSKVEMDPNFVKLIELGNKDIKVLEEKLNEIDSTLSGIEKGFLKGELIDEALSKLDKNLKIFGENCMKILEIMDSLLLSEDASDKARMKRKSLVEDVQHLLRQHDDLLERVSNIRLKLIDQQRNGHS